MRTRLLLLPALTAAAGLAGSSVGYAAAAKPKNLTPPTISGAAQPGQVLTATPGTWSGSTPMTFRYQWRRCDTQGALCASVVAATRTTYMLASADKGHTMRVVVTAANRYGSTAATSAQTAAVGATGQASGLHVVGNLLEDASGKVVHLHGVNRSGTEYACIQDWGIFDGPNDSTSIAAMATWNVNIVRVPLNEDCWLGINGVDPAYSGAAYRQAIVDYVNLLHSHGMYAELSLIWAAPGTYQATYQSGSPDEDHSPAMWSSLAATFKNDPGVILAPWGETVVDADCFLNGGVCETTYGPNDAPYDTAGMQQAVDVMRQAGYTGVIAVPGIDYANDLSQWLSHEPSDPLHQLIAEAHVYGKNTCDTTQCFDTNYAPVAAKVPLVFGETGETYDASDCGSSYISTFLTWADAHGVGYEAWTWDSWGDCGVLIADYGGTPYSAWGAWVKSHYLGLS
jgi:hypothetical protein